jgi:uncharacterized protein (DUF305 family)
MVRLGALASTALLSFGLTASAAMAAEPAPEQEQAQFEQQFLTMTIGHHASGVAMADLCVEKSTREDLTQPCTATGEVQAQEIETMRAWLQEWYGTDVEPSVAPEQQATLDELADLSGATFDAELASTFAMHHEGMIERAQECQDGAYLDELLQLCATIEQAQLTELEQFQGIAADARDEADSGAPTTVDAGQGGFADGGTSGSLPLFALAGLGVALAGAAGWRLVRR